MTATVVGGPVRPPLIPPSQPPEQLRFMERVTEPPDEPSSGVFSGSRILWFLALLGIAVGVIAVVLLLRIRVM